MERRWNDIDRCNPKYTNKICPTTIFSTTNPTWAGLESKLGLRDDRDLRPGILWPVKAQTTENVNKSSGSIAGGELLEQLSDHKLLKHSMHLSVILHTSNVCQSNYVTGLLLFSKNEFIYTNCYL